MNLLKQTGPFILSVVGMIFGTWVAADIGYPPSKFMLTYAVVVSILSAIGTLIYIHVIDKPYKQFICHALIYLTVCLTLIMPSCYGLLTSANIMPVEFRNVYEDTVFSAAEPVMIPYGEYRLKGNENGEVELLHYDKSTGEYVTGPIETTIGIPDTLGECIDLQIECWQDDEQYRRVYYREANTE